MTIIVSNPKGGAGQTTIVASLSTAWHQDRGPAASEIRALVAELDALAEEIDAA